MNYSDLNVVVLAYSRPGTFEKVIRSCEKHLNKIKIVMDYPASSAIAMQQDKIITIINNLNIEYELKRRKENHGLVRSVLTTVKEELEDNDHIVLLEDDCVPHKQFFQFVCDSLKKHKDNEQISTVCGTITRCRFNPWGWATWKHKWNYQYLSDKEVLEISNLDEELRQFIKNNSIEESIWSLSWLAYQYANNCTALYPERNLIKNIGIDDSGVHSAEKGYTKWLLSQIIAK